MILTCLPVLLFLPKMFYVLKHQMISESMNQNLIDTSHLASLVMQITHHSVSPLHLEFT